MKRTRIFSPTRNTLFSLTLLLCCMLAGIGQSWAALPASQNWENSTFTKLGDGNYKFYAPYYMSEPITVTTQGDLSINYKYTEGSWAFPGVGFDLVDDNGVVKYSTYAPAPVGGGQNKTWTINDVAPGRYNIRYMTSRYSNDGDFLGRSDPRGTITVSGTAATGFTPTITGWTHQGWSPVTYANPGLWEGLSIYNKYSAVANVHTYSSTATFMTGGEAVVVKFQKTSGSANLIVKGVELLDASNKIVAADYRDVTVSSTGKYTLNAPANGTYIVRTLVQTSTDNNVNCTGTITYVAPETWTVKINDGYKVVYNGNAYGNNEIVAIDIDTHDYRGITVNAPSTKAVWGPLIDNTNKTITFEIGDPVAPQAGRWYKVQVLPTRGNLDNTNMINAFNNRIKAQGVKGDYIYVQNAEQPSNRSDYKSIHCFMGMPENEAAAYVYVNYFTNNNILLQHINGRYISQDGKQQTTVQNSSDVLLTCENSGDYAGSYYWNQLQPFSLNDADIAHYFGRSSNSTNNFHTYFVEVDPNEKFDMYKVIITGGDANSGISYRGSKSHGLNNIYNGGYYFFEKGHVPTVADFTVTGATFTNMTIEIEESTEGNFKTLTFCEALSAEEVQVTYNVYDGIQDEAHKLTTLHVREIIGTVPRYGNEIPAFVTTTGGPATIQQSDDGQTYNVVTTMTTPFAPNTETLYTAYLRDGYILNTLATVGAAPTDAMDDTYKYAWKFTGDWYNGFYMQSAKDDKYLNPGTNNNAGKITTVANKSDARPLELLVSDGHYVFRSRGTSNVYLNRRSNEVGTFYNIDVGAYLTFNPIDPHYKIQNVYMWDNTELKVDIYSKHRGDALPAVDVPDGYLSKSITPALPEPAIVSGACTYTIDLYKKVRVNFENDSYSVGKGVARELPAYTVVDVENKKLIDGVEATVTFTSADESKLAVDAYSMRGVAPGETRLVANVTLNELGQRYYSYVEGSSTATVTVTDGVMTLRFTEPSIMLVTDEDNTGGVVQSGTVNFTGASAMSQLVIEPAAAIAGATIENVIPSENDKIVIAIAGDKKSVNLTERDTDANLTLTFRIASTGYQPTDVTLNVRVMNNSNIVAAKRKRQEMADKPVGSGLGRYTYTGAKYDGKSGNEAYNAAYAKFTEYCNKMYSYSDADIVKYCAEINTFCTDLNSKLNLNMPVAGKTLLRAKGKSGKYISGAVTPQDNNSTTRVSMIDNSIPANTILYYTKDKELIGYVNGLGFNGIWYYASVGGGKDVDEFSQYGTIENNSGKYSIATSYGSPHDDGNSQLNRCTKGSDHDQHAWTLEDVTELPVTIGTTGYATLCSPVALTVPYGVEAYVDVERKAPVNNISVIKLQKLNGVIPANTAVVLRGREGNYNFRVTTSSYDIAIEGAENGGWTNNVVMQGTYPTLVADDSKYTLQKKSDAINFYPNSSSAQLKPFRVFIPTEPRADKVQMFMMDFGGGLSMVLDTTIDTSESSAPAYDLSGRMMQPTHRGIYLQQGRKVLVH